MASRVLNEEQASLIGDKKMSRKLTIYGDQLKHYAVRILCWRSWQRDDGALYCSTKCAAFHKQDDGYVFCRALPQEGQQEIGKAG
jgi:hypothetical protein